MDLPKIPEWPLSLKLQLEKKGLGVYLSDHPLNYYGTYIRAFASHSISSLLSLSPATRVLVGGICVEVRVSSRYPGRKVRYTATFDDRTGVHDIIIFAEPDEFLRFIKEDTIGFVSGRISIYEDVKQLVLDHFVSLARSPFAFGRYLVIHLSPDHMSKLGVLNSLLRRFSMTGTSGVAFDLDGVFLRSKTLRIALNETLVTYIDRLLGPGNVKIVGRRGIAVDPWIKSLDDFPVKQTTCRAAMVAMLPRLISNSKRDEADQLAGQPKLF